MAFFGVVELLVHLHSFRNIDLFHQGLYRLRVHIYQDCRDAENNNDAQTGVGSESDNTGLNDHECVVAFPYGVISPTRHQVIEHNSRHSNGKFNAKQNGRDEVLPAFIDDSNHTFSSDTFLIRFCDEEVELNQICQFRMEVDLSKAQAFDLPLFMEVDLMFADPAVQSGEGGATSKTKDSLGGTGAATSSEPTRSFLNDSTVFTSRLKSFESAATTSSTEATPDFVSACYQIFRITGFAKDVRARVRPNIHPCVLPPRHKQKRPPPTLIYSPPRPLEQAGISTIVERSGTCFLDFINLGHRALRSDELASVVPQTSNHLGPIKTDPPFLPLNSRPGEDFVGSPTSLGGSGVDELGPLSLRKAEVLHAAYLRKLLTSLVNLAAFYRNLGYKALVPKQRASLEDALALSPIVLPGGGSFLLPGAVAPDPAELESLERQDSRSHETSNIDNQSLLVSLGGREFTLLQITVHVSQESITEELARAREDAASRGDSSSSGDVSPVATPDEAPVPPEKFVPIDIRCRVPRLSHSIHSATPSSVCTRMSQDFHLLSGQLMQLWLRLASLLPDVGAEVEAILKRHNDAREAERYWSAIFRETTTTDSLGVPQKRAIWEVHNRMAEHLRRSHHFASLELPPVLDIFTGPPPPSSHPVLFEQLYRAKSGIGEIAMTSGAVFKKSQLPTPTTSKDRHAYAPKRGRQQIKLSGSHGVHLIVLVHGFQGNAYDMRLMKNVIAYSYPSVVLLCSSANEDDTEGSIQVMGDRLADEVIKYINEWCPNSTLSRLSFICHSLGGLIARASFDKLKTYWPKFYTFLTLSSPHLGYMYNGNKLIETGLWFLKKWKKSIALQQLTLSESKTIRESYLYQLAMNSAKVLSQFKHVCFISSFQDQYVPFESARVEISGRVESDTKNGPLFLEMVQSLLKYLDPKNLTRIDVNFKITEKSLDTFIGRAAHILFLESQHLMRVITTVYPHFFE